MFQKIKKGDMIGVIAPSSKIDKDDLEVQASKLSLERMLLKTH